MASKKILVVDDEPMVATLLKVRVSSHGFLVETANDGVSGLEKAKSWQPDLILLDIAMLGMDGYETCRQLKAAKETGHIPVVFFTALREEKIESLAQEVGAARVVQKPFVDGVFKAILEILGSE